MKYTQRATLHTYDWGGTIVTAPHAMAGYVTLVGSVSGGTQGARGYLHKSGTLSSACMCKSKLYFSAEKSARSRRRAARDFCTCMPQRASDTPEYSGETLAQMHAAMLMEGTKKKTKHDIQLLLDHIAATLTFSSTVDRLTFSARVHRDHIDTLLALITEIFTSSTFPTTELEVLRAQSLAENTLESQDTRTQATIALTQSLYPPNHPLRDDTTACARSTIEHISAKDLAQYHAQCIDRGSLVIAVVGDIEQTEAHLSVEKHFAKLPTHTIQTLEYSDTHTIEKSFVTVPLPEKLSIDYLLGIPTTITDAHPDFPALVLAINILAHWGGFSGRLMSIVREVEGLTYGVYGRLNGFAITQGYLSIWGTFAPELFAKGRASIRREISYIVKEGVTAEEFKRHRDMYVASTTVMNLDSVSLARTLHETVVRNKPISYLDTFPLRINALTKKKVEKAIKTYLTLENAIESAAGPV